MLIEWTRRRRGATVWRAAYLLIAIGGLLATSLVPYVSGWVTFAFASRLAILIWGPYLLTAPLVWRLSSTLPLGEGMGRRNIWIHVGGTLAFILLCEMLRMGFMTILGIPTRPPITGRFQPPPRGFPGVPPPIASPLHPRPPPPGLLMKAQFHVAIYWLIVISNHFVASMRRLRQRERQQVLLQAELTQARLQSLQRQLQPHFLFNALNTISALIHEQPKVADEMLSNLSDLLRVTLDQKQQPETTMENELLVLGFYLDIQLVRFGHRLRIEQNVPADVLDALVPAFILQPIVENAIEHGISQTDKPGIITLNAERTNNYLVLQVRDNGPGLARNQQNTAGNGIGLSNTRNRLQTLYGTDYAFKLHSEPFKGFCVEIQIPFHLAPISAALSPGQDA